MLNAKNVEATIAVKDLERAREFYEGKLRLKQRETDGENYIEYQSGDSSLLVYKSDFAGGYGATVATWNVGSDIKNIVQTLKSQDVPFEHYDMPGAKLEGDIHVIGKIKNAWCRDPDGNILSLVSA